MNDNGRTPPPPHLLYDPQQDTARAGEGQCDCACVATTPARRPNMEGSDHDSNGRYRLADSFRTFAITPEYYTAVAQDAAPIVLNQSALNLAHFFKEPHRPDESLPVWQNFWGEKVIKEFLNQMIHLRHLVHAEDKPSPLVEHPETLTAWLHLTDRCNLRCAYCYLPHKRVDMPLAVGHAAIDATFRSAVQHHYRQVKLKYAGGEPLLRFPDIITLQQYAHQLAHTHDISLDGVVLSNGTLLTPEMVTHLHHLNLRLMISLDGLGQFHDQQRPYAGGHGTFDDTVRGIKTALAVGLTPDISVTINGRSAAGLPDLVAWLLSQELPFSLNFYRENELSASHKELALEEENIITHLLAAFQIIKKQLPRHSLLASLIDRANLATPHLRTCGVGHSYLVFDYQGNVSKCQMHMAQPITTTAAPDPLAWIRADQIGIQNISVEDKEECKQCDWKHWCTGGCPLVTHRATGRFDVKSPNCHIYKTLYPEAVRLEGLRLLTYAAAPN